MKIKEVIKQLNNLKEEEKELDLYITDEKGDNYIIKSISLYNEDEIHSFKNPLGVNYENRSF